MLDEESDKTAKQCCLERMGFQYPHVFSTTCAAKSFSGKKYRDYIKYIAFGEMGFKPGEIMLYRNGTLVRTGKINIEKIDTDMEMTTIHPAESYLPQRNQSSVFIRADCGKTQTLVHQPRQRYYWHYRSRQNRTKGYVFTDWASIEQIYYPSQEQDKNTDRKLILKYQKLCPTCHTYKFLAS